MKSKRQSIHLQDSRSRWIDGRKAHATMKSWISEQKDWVGHEENITIPPLRESGDQSSYYVASGEYASSDPKRYPMQKMKPLTNLLPHQG